MIYGDEVRVIGWKVSSGIFEFIGRISGLGIRVFVLLYTNVVLYSSATLCANVTLSLHFMLN